MSTEQPDTEDEIIAAMAQAGAAGGLPMVLTGFTGPPSTAEFYFTLMRDMVETNGEATGCITFGTEESSGMMPLVGFDPQTGLELLILMRQMKVFGPVNWVTLATDAARRKFLVDEVDPDDIQKGDVLQMKAKGDPIVEDVLMVTCVAPDGPGYDQAQTYKITEDGVEWGEVEDLPSGASGGVPELMQQLVTA